MAKFQKGQIANPTGRPAGSKDRRTELRQLLQPHAAELLQKAVDMALDGDLGALRLCLDRICPTLKATSDPIEISFPLTGTLGEQAAAVFMLAARGEIAADSATQFISMLSSQCRIKELTELELRLQALEERGKV